jgi:hypothetical protein
MQSILMVQKDGTIYIGSYDNKLYAISSNGIKKWEFQADDWVPTSPSVGTDGTIYIGSHDNRLYAICGTSSIADTPWPMFRHDQQHTGQLTLLRDGLIVTHTPNPCDVHTHPSFAENPFKYMWYYRTEVQNISQTPLQIIWFAGYSWVNGNWISGNITGQSLDSNDFENWYTDSEDGFIPENGVIPTGKTAVCDPNWTGSTTDPSGGGKTKWAYIATDPYGCGYYAEAVVDLVPITE